MSTAARTDAERILPGPSRDAAEAPDSRWPVARRQVTRAVPR